jgi:uncharacterized protein DUF397
MRWIRSSECEQGACVEVAFADCDTAACVEVAFDGPLVAVRNSNIPGEIVWFTPEEWEAFRKGVMNHEFDM